MPSTYAHYRMGEQIRSMLSEDKKKIVEENIDLYYIGLHGPDPFFYYNPIFPNLVNQIGSENHEMSGREFFERVLRVLKDHDYDKKYLAYAYGVLCHFALDAMAHGYVEEKVAGSGISHMEVEMEFDRYLLVYDKKNPLEYDLVRHFSATRENAKIIAAFYPGTDAKLVFRALKDFRFYHHVMYCPRRGKRFLLFSVMKLAHVYEKMKGHIMSVKPNRYCEDSNQRLHKLYKRGRILGADLIEHFLDYSFIDGEFREILLLNFESQKMEG